MNWISVTVSLAFLALGVASQTEQEPFYEFLETWPGNFKGNFCVTAPQDLYGWTVRLDFEEAVTSLQTWDLNPLSNSADMTTYKLTDMGYNGHWTEGERRCFQFIGSRSDLTSGVNAEVNITDIPEAEVCPPPIQSFSQSVLSQWQGGLSARFCLTAPQAFTGTWKIRMDLSQSVTDVQSYETPIQMLDTAAEWLLTPASYNGDLYSGETICLGFQITMSEWSNLCINAFFVMDDNVTPVT